MGDICSRPQPIIIKKSAPNHKRCPRTGKLVYSSQFLCKHEPYCEECELEFFQVEFCTICSRSFSPSELSNFSKTRSKICDTCGVPKLSTKEYNCDCFLCEDCFSACKSKNQGYCQTCNKLVIIPEITSNNTSKKDTENNPSAFCAIC